jgi:hypothetical protein
MCQFIINKLIKLFYLSFFFFFSFFRVQNTYISNSCACLMRNQTVFILFYFIFMFGELQNLVNTITFLLKLTLDQPNMNVIKSQVIIKVVH